MSETADQIRRMREALDQIERELQTGSSPSALRNLDALELPDLVGSIVDHLQPQLLPYEAAIYWALFRRSALASGQQYMRASVRGLQGGVVKSSSGQSKDPSYATVQLALEGLERKGAILKAGDTNRDGTLYKICLPEEIEICRDSMKQAAMPEPEVVALRELDFYNVAENRLKVFERDGFQCAYCKKQLTRFSATVDHLQPVSRGGDNSFTNLVTACLHCNSRRGNRPVMDAIGNVPGGG